jgi:hypothetical protein
MRAHIASVVTGTASVVLFTTSILAAPAARLSADDIQATFFNSQQFTAATPFSVKYKMMFTADGKMKHEPSSGGGAKGEGTYKLSKDGFCRTWKGAKENCFTVVSAGENKWSVLKGTAIIPTWSE